MAVTQNSGWARSVPYTGTELLDTNGYSINCCQHLLLN
jgi:hypothetical protein